MVVTRVRARTALVAMAEAEMDLGADLVLGLEALGPVVLFLRGGGEGEDEEEGCRE